jgi:hypothetical protein
MRSSDVFVDEFPPLSADQALSRGLNTVWVRRFGFRRCQMYPPGLAGTRRINWGCATCTAMCGNGARTCSLRRNRTGRSGAAAGSNTALAAGRRSAAGTCRRSGTAPSASVLPEFPFGRGQASRSERPRCPERRLLSRSRGRSVSSAGSRGGRARCGTGREGKAGRWPAHSGEGVTDVCTLAGRTRPSDRIGGST